MTCFDKNSDEDLDILLGRWLNTYHSISDLRKKSKIKALIVTKMLPIIKKIAHTIARRSYDPIEDLVQAGSIGLLKAIDCYTVELNDSFKIYAGYRIIGEMKHYLRDKLNTIRVPRYIQELNYRINTFTSTLTLDEINNLTNEDVAEALKVSTKAIDNAVLADRRKLPVSLEEIYATSNDSLSYEELFPVDNYKETTELEDTKIILKDVIEQLPEEYRNIVKMYYYDDMNQKEIAEIYNITQMQISRKFKKAFSLLYKLISEISSEE